MPISIENDDIETALKKLKAREDNFKQLEAVSGLSGWEVDLITKKAIWSDRSYEVYGLHKDQVDTSLDFFSRSYFPKTSLM